MTNADEAGCTVIDLKHTVIPDVIRCMNQRFVSFDQEIFKSMLWIDPANWTSDDSEDLAAIQVNGPLQVCKFIKPWKTTMLEIGKKRRWERKGEFRERERSGRGRERRERNRGPGGSGDIHVEKGGVRMGGKGRGAANLFRILVRWGM